MIRKAYFFKNVKNIEELERKTNLAIDNNDKAQNYVVLERHIIENSKFINFCQSFAFTNRNINNITHKLTMNDKYEYICISLTSEESDFEILINSSGYSYARIVAIIKKGNINGL